MKLATNSNPFSAHSKPHTRLEWQIAADLAQLCLALAMARRYGLIDANGRIDEAACQEFLKRAQGLAIQPRTFWRG